ncbi:MAG: hypothetical protein IEMM0002_1095 [bacterium]|nr:MAG: hypothetical protein IEMM0002_1095 [bacterium]
MDTTSKDTEGKVTKVTVIGSIFAGGLAAACCLGPVLFALLGIGGIGLIANIAQYRTPLMALSFLLLATAFYFAYRKPEECGAECPPSAGNRLNKIIVWVAAVLLLVFIGLPYFAGGGLTKDSSSGLSTKADTTMGFAAASNDKHKAPETIPLAVNGMTCTSCERPIRNALKKLPGVSGVKVSYKTGEAVVEYDQEKVTPQQMIDAVKKAGYTASVK